MKTGFFVRQHRERCEFFLFPSPSPGSSSLLSAARRDGVVVVFLGRLYYRDDLLRHVPNARREELRAQSDSELVAFLLAMYSIQCLVWLEGDFTFCAHDCDRHILVAFRDSGGAFPLFYAPIAKGLIVSTSLRRILVDVGHEEL